MFDALKDILSGQHQFASDGLLLMIVGGLGVYMRAIPQRLWDWFVGQTTLMITVKDDDAAFVWVDDSKKRAITHSINSRPIIHCRRIVC